MRLQLLRLLQSFARAIYLVICYRLQIVYCRFGIDVSVRVPVRWIVLNSVYVRRFTSFVYRNVIVICNEFGWTVDEFLLGNVTLCNAFFERRYKCSLSVDARNTCAFLHELIMLRDGQLALMDVQFTRSDVQLMIDTIACA